MNRLSLLLGASFAFLSVALGAFAAHGLKNHFDEYQMSIFRTGVEYQFFHSLALILLASLAGKFEESWLKFAMWAFVAGILIFSGSLYALAVSKVKALGAITPIGGLSFLLGWAFLILASLRRVG